jgi:hypothetical protein
MSRESRYYTTTHLDNNRFLRYTAEEHSILTPFS